AFASFGRVWSAPCFGAAHGGCAGNRQRAPRILDHRHQPCNPVVLPAVRRLVISGSPCRLDRVFDRRRGHLPLGGWPGESLFAAGPRGTRRPPPPLSRTYRRRQGTKTSPPAPTWIFGTPARADLRGIA